MLIIIIIFSYLLGLCLSYFKIPSSWMLGAFILSGFANFFELIKFQLPDVILIPIYILMGCIIGSRNYYKNKSKLISVLKHSISIYSISFSFCLIISIFISKLLKLPFEQVLISYVPGGMEVMILVSFMLDLDSNFVTSHQMIRFIFITILFPIVTKIIFKKR